MFNDTQNNVFMKNGGNKALFVNDFYVMENSK